MKEKQWNNEGKTSIYLFALWFIALTMKEQPETMNERQRTTEEQRSNYKEQDLDYSISNR